MLSASRVFNGSRPLFAAKSGAATTPKMKTTTATSPVSPKPSSKSSTKKPRFAQSMFRKEIPVSPALQSFLGVPESTRPNVMKKIWEYIKLHNLQNPANKREIFCDEKLKTVFEDKDKVGMLEIPKLLSPHFVKLRPTEMHSSAAPEANL